MLTKKKFFFDIFTHIFYSLCKLYLLILWTKELCTMHDQHPCFGYKHRYTTIFSENRKFNCKFQVIRASSTYQNNCSCDRYYAFLIKNKIQSLSHMIPIDQVLLEEGPLLKVFSYYWVSELLCSWLLPKAFSWAT